MAKAKSQFSFNVIKENLFWICVPLAVVVMTGVFFVAIGSAKANYTKRKEELESLKKSVEEVKNNTKHPNDNTIKDIQGNIVTLRSNVFSAWESMYENQKKYFVWSPEIGSQFVRDVQNMKRFEPFKRPEYREWYNNFVERQLPEFLETAKRRKVKIKKYDLKTREPELDKNGEEVFIDVDPYVVNATQMMRANAKKLSTGSSMSGMGGGSEMGMGGGSSGSFGWSGGMTAASGGTNAAMSMGGGGSGMSGMDNSSVSGMASTAGMSDSTQLFDSANQKVEGVVDWPNPEIYRIVTWEAVPTSAQIWFAQEDIWVYNSLIHIVRNINDRVKATGPHNAAIKRIQSMLIGQDASQIVGNPNILMPLGPLTGGGMMGGDMMGSDMGSSDMSSSSMGSSDSMGMDGGMSAAPLTEEDIFKYLKRRRYVDLDMKPLAEEDAPPMAEVNIMPVCLDLIVDQRKISDILVECANSPMPIDVKLVRYSPGMAQTGVLGAGLPSSGMGGDSMSGGGGMSSGSMGGGGMGGGGMGGSGAQGMGADTSALNQFDIGGKIGPYGSDAVNIQIIGVIYVYNEPDKEKLATGASAQSSGIEGGLGDTTLIQATTSETPADDASANANETATPDSATTNTEPTETVPEEPATTPEETTTPSTEENPTPPETPTAEPEASGTT